MFPASTADALDQAVASIRAERQARRDLRAARDALVEALLVLKDGGVAASVVAFRLGRALGEVLSVAQRRRLAAALRQRRSRAQRLSVTVSHADHAASHGQAPPIAPTSDRALTPTEKEPNMAKLVKRVVTEEFLARVDDEAEGLDDLEAADDVDDDESDEEEDARPAKRARRR